MPYNYNTPIDLDPRDGYGEISDYYSQVLDLILEGEGSSDTNLGVDLPHGGGSPGGGSSGGGSSGEELPIPGAGGGKTTDSVDYGSGSYNLPSTQEFNQLTAATFANDIYENLAASPTQTYHNPHITNLSSIFSGIRTVNPLVIEIDKDPTTVIVGVSGVDLPLHPGAGGPNTGGGSGGSSSGGSGGGSSGAGSPSNYNGTIPNAGGVTPDSGVDVGGPPINGGSGPGINLFLPPNRTIAGVNLPFRVNHRNRGARESSKFILLGQKLFYIILAFKETLKVGQRKVDDNFDSIYPSNTQIAQIQHCLIQAKFFEELRTRKITTRWFN